ncbi:MAG: hypothetical protein WA081_16550 [Desulfosalsimonadaceae bacterium]
MMRWKRTALIFMIAGIIFSGIGACAARSAAHHSAASDEEATGVMGLILAESARFESVTVTVTGVFNGWRGPCPGGPPVSRSDWMIADPSGCLYVHGPVPPGLDAAKPAGEKISVTGVVRLKKGRPYLEVVKEKR